MFKNFISPNKTKSFLQDFTGYKKYRKEDINIKKS